MQERLLADPQQLNTYAYARNNPSKYVDPDGRQAVQAFLGITIGIVAPELLVPTLAGGSAALLTIGVDAIIERGNSVGWQPFDTRRLVQTPGPMQVFDPEPPTPDKNWLKYGLVGTGLISLLDNVLSPFVAHEDAARQFKNASEPRQQPFIGPVQQKIGPPPTKPLPMIAPAPSKEQREIDRIRQRKEAISSPH